MYARKKPQDKSKKVLTIGNHSINELYRYAYIQT